MPRSYIEQYRMIDAASVAAELGHSALVLASEIEEARPRLQAKTVSEGLPPIIADTLRVIETSTLELFDEIRNKRIPPQIFTELNQLSLGRTEEDVARKRGVPKTTVKSWRKEIKNYLGARTRNGTVTTAINRGLIHIKPADPTDFGKLSYMEERVLACAAADWTTREIAEYFKLSQNTIDRYYEEVRNKLKAKNIPHAVRRGFEIGIFKAGEPISTLVEVVRSISLKFLDHSGGPVSVEVDDPREIDLLWMMAEIGNGSLIVRQALWAEGQIQPGKAPHVGRTMLGLRRKLEEAAGEPVILRSRLRINGERTHIYHLSREVNMDDGEKSMSIPEFKRKASQNKGGRPRLYKVSQPTRTSIIDDPPERPLPRLKTIEERIASLPEYLEPSELPPSDEKLFNSMQPRPVIELSPYIMNAVYKLADGGCLTYRQKLTLALRFGVPPKLMCLSTINRAGQLVDASLLPDLGHGLDIESASLLSGLTQSGILKTELQIIEDNKKRYPALEPLQEKLIRQLVRIAEKADLEAV